MGAIKLSDISVTPLSRIERIGGDVLHAIKNTEIGYVGFGEAYFSWVSTGIIKAWKFHKRMTMNLIVPFGQIKFVFCCINENGKKEFRVEEIGEDYYARITVPPGVWFGFQGIGLKNLVLNVASIPHDTDEVERLLVSDIAYVWS